MAIMRIPAGGTCRNDCALFKLNLDKGDYESSLSVNTRKREREGVFKRLKSVRLTILSEQDRKSFHPSIS